MSNDFLNTNAASDELHRLLPEKTTKQWYAWLQNNRNVARKAVYRIPFERLGVMALYRQEDLVKFVEWEKSRRIGEMKLDSRTVEIMQAFGIGDPSVTGTTGRKLELVSVTGQHDETRNVAFVQLALGNPLRIYRLELDEVTEITFQLVNAYKDAANIQRIIDEGAKK
ncbi:MAG: hypothetical protein P4L87_06785 [Formivibrio sp.]|nr:hypothetical protein [Formivibrio sp.]